MQLNTIQFKINSNELIWNTTGGVDGVEDEQDDPESCP